MLQIFPEKAFVIILMKSLQRRKDHIPQLLVELGCLVFKGAEVAFGTTIPFGFGFNALH